MWLYWSSRAISHPACTIPIIHQLVSSLQQKHPQLLYTILMVPLILLTIGGLIASFVIWLQFRHDHYDEKRIIDLILLTFVGVVVGSQLGAIWQHVDALRDAVPATWHVDPLELNLHGALLVPLVAVFVFVKKVDWPILKTYDRLALGLLIGGLFFSLSIAGFEGTIIVYPMLLAGQVAVPIWVTSLLCLASIGIWWSVLRTRGIAGEVLCLALLCIPRELFLLTGVVGWLIIRYRQLWRNKRRKNN